MISAGMTTGTADDTHDDTDNATGLAAVQARVDAAARAAGRAPDEVRLIAISKTFPAEAIAPVLAAGHRDFGENRVQEAAAKWPPLQEVHPDLRLDLVGPLQTNKARDAVALFDVIHSIDRDRLAAAIAREIKRQDRRPALYVQVNTGEEAQKAGIKPAEARDFVRRCRDEHGLAITGLMCIPPFDDPPAPHFALLADMAADLDVTRLSMGMSADFETAIAFGATDIRVGTAIFGQRSTGPAQPTST